MIPTTPKILTTPAIPMILTTLMTLMIPTALILMKVTMAKDMDTIPVNPFYSANDHNNDGKLTDEEFSDAMEDAIDYYSSFIE